MCPGTAGRRRSAYGRPVRITVLGGLGAFPTARQACSGFLVEHDGFRLLIDPGYATLQPLLAHVPAEHVDGVYVSHGHPDHCADLQPLVRARVLTDAFGTQCGNENVRTSGRVGLRAARLRRPGGRGRSRADRDRQPVESGGAGVRGTARRRTSVRERWTPHAAADRALPSARCRPVGSGLVTASSMPLAERRDNAFTRPGY
ncbi:MBL fold metallo-hydrolase [Micromonospora sp. WMMD980]|uniref:MBL fold metallo-hydrolase n=1 Tax=Micromonospora sp. WMMD980 TaxID=3016088 RepID=UPI002417708A|nr:MBL fold metallo-hydrolase [Micromonospora sp. WMMD980]MDG4802313.1 MBL fold metallo-hydrolase [Micromonospora sp. WMMD980]